MIKKYLFGICLTLLCHTLTAQHTTHIEARLIDSTRTIQISQRLDYTNYSRDTLEYIYLNDWLNAFSHKRTPLARRFFEDYDRDFHFARDEKRGHTTIQSVSDIASETLNWKRPPGHPDLVLVSLEAPLPPGETTTLNLEYSVKVPHVDFTGFGFSNNGEYYLRYWFMTPGVYDEGWRVYSHKNMGDLYMPELHVEIAFTLPNRLAPISAWEIEEVDMTDTTKTIKLSGRHRLETSLFLTHSYAFEDIETDSLRVLTNMRDEGINPVLKSLLVKRIVDFLGENLGTYPHETILSTQQDYAASPVYGLNQLPKFLRPFPVGFSYDLKQFKTLTGKYLKNTLLLNPRKENWIYDAIATYLLMEYVEEYYPDLKLLGSLSKMIGIRWFHIADLEFNEQYPLLYLYMARKEIDQALSEPTDSLANFNKSLANPYKAGVGLKYLEHFLGEGRVQHALRDFYKEYQLKPSDQPDFERVLEKHAQKDIDWFFKEFVETDEKIDFKIVDIHSQGDSLEVTVRNKTKNGMPISLYALSEDRVVYKTWIEHARERKTVKIPAKGVERVALNIFGEVPEVNRRNNYREVGAIIHKPIQFRLFKDIEDPRYTQLFFMPEVQYNLYDGLSFGAKVYNSTLLDKNFEFSIAPLYGMTSKTLVGSAGFSHAIFFEDDHLHSIRYGASGSRFSFGYNRFYERVTPYLSMSFRDSPLRNSQKEYLTIRNVNVFRDENPEEPLEVEDYSVFNINYAYSNPGLVDHVTGRVDFQIAEQFGKASFTLEYGKLLKNDRQVNLRFFGGAFFYNDLPHSDYFSFALDRPTDYLFDYNYYGRSETSGFFSQQIILAEGGFKSKLEPKFANQWIATLNGSTTIWKWIFAYADIGLVKNRTEDAKILYDSGIRASIVQNYFEIFFPVYSSNGWEFHEGPYDQKIRFIVTLDIKTILGLFTREWF